MIVALAGGVGGARLAVGLAAVLSPERLTVVVNTGDDFEHLGLTICPDLDTVMYTLAGVENPQTGWGRADETWSFMETLQRLGGEAWFRLGDRDLAVHVVRTHALQSGGRLSEITRELCRRLGIRHAIVPMSDEPVRTFVATDEGELAFQEYFVRRKCAPAVRGFRFAGSEKAHVPAALQAVFDSAAIEGAVICPSNPYVSIAPMLALRDIGEWLRGRRFPIVAVSPIVAGQAVKGPAAKMMKELGHDPTAVAIARHYGDLVDGWIVDRQDTACVPQIEALGAKVVAADTMMTSRARSTALARVVLELAARLSVTLSTSERGQRKQRSEEG
jgi:LPPG:FO 2-phospho-L-lactate transferase